MYHISSGKRTFLAVSPAVPPFSLRFVWSFLGSLPGCLSSASCTPVGVAPLSSLFQLSDVVVVVVVVPLLALGLGGGAGAGAAFAWRARPLGSSAGLSSSVSSMCS